MDDRRWERLAALTGVAFVVTVLVSAFLVPQQLKVDDPISKIGSHFGNHRTGLLLAAWIGGLASLFVLWFVGTVSAYLRRHGAGRMAAIALGGGVAATGIGLLGTWIGGSLAWMANHYGIGAQSVRVLWTLNAVTNTVIWFPVAVFVAAVSMGV